MKINHFDYLKDSQPASTDLFCAGSIISPTMSDGKDCGEFSSDSTRSPIPLIYEHLESTTLPKDNIFTMLDEIESHVESIRKTAFQIEEERDAMFTTLHALKHSQLVEDLPDLDRDDVDRYVERIYNRCSTIEVTVKTVRNKPQEEALHKINGLIDTLITEFKHDPNSSKARCLSYMNSCTSNDDNGIPDRIFEQTLLGCTVDDQKRVRRRLRGLMNYIEKLSLTS